MVEVFITNIQNEQDATNALGILQNLFPSVKANIDLEDFEEPYPCTHSVLRVEGKEIYSEAILTLLRNKGIECEILPDKTCS
jgi:hypothetical protein